MGTYDEVSHDWNDGVIANIMRICSTDKNERRKWIVFDGPIDPVWVENLNSVMDDNKKLSLSTGETIRVSSNISSITYKYWVMGYLKVLRIIYKYLIIAFLRVRFLLKRSTITYFT